MATNHRSLDDIDLAIIDELVASPPQPGERHLTRFLSLLPSLYGYL